MGCSNANRNEELEEAIFPVISGKNNDEFHLNPLTNFEWEEAHIITPYATKEGIEEQLGVKYKDKSNIFMRDDFFLLVFIKDGKAIQYAEIEHQGSILSAGEEKYLTPSNDIIYINRYD